MGRSRIVRIEDVFREALDPPAPVDVQIALEPCPGCGARQTLYQCSVRLSGEDTEYVCKNGDWVLARVRPPWSPARAGEGWMLSGYLVQNFVEMKVPGKG